MQQALDAIDAFADPAGGMPQDTGEFRALAAAGGALRKVLAGETIQPQSACRHLHSVSSFNATTTQIGHYCPDCQAAWITYPKSATLTVPKPAI
jgi:hypothetical protein